MLSIVCVQCEEGIEEMPMRKHYGHGESKEDFDSSIDAIHLYRSSRAWLSSNHVHESRWLWLNHKMIEISISRLHPMSNVWNFRCYVRSIDNYQHAFSLFFGQLCYEAHGLQIMRRVSHQLPPSETIS